jgi:hypothetical protein
MYVFLPRKWILVYSYWLAVNSRPDATGPAEAMGSGRKRRATQACSEGGEGCTRS